MHTRLDEIAITRTRENSLSKKYGASLCSAQIVDPHPLGVLFLLPQKN